MFDPKLISERGAWLRAQIGRRGEAYANQLDKVEEVVECHKRLKRSLEGLRHEQKTESKRMRTVKGEEQVALRARLKEMSEKLKHQQNDVRELEAQKEELLLHLPNLPDEAIPTGGEEHNEELARVGEPPHFSFTPKPHWELGEFLGILDFEAAARMSGSRFSVLKGAGARLERAIAQFMLDSHAARGYTEISPPLLVKRDAMVGTGQVPHLEEDTYKTVQEDPFYLIPTSEVVLVNMHREEILPSEALPIRYTACTPCFRSEAGSYGRDVRGLIRQHQFYKVELVKITTPETSSQELEALREDAEFLLKTLGLPYRRMLLASQDMGFAAHRTYDLEVWLPSEGAYREISSCSNCTDFQARNAKIRYRAVQGEKPRLVHTLNGSGLAVGRTLLAILENYQNEDGSVTLPKALRPYLGGATAITPNGLEGVPSGCPPDALPPTPTL